MERRHESRVAAELLQRCDRGRRPLRRQSLSLEDERAHRLVDRREIAMEELLGLVRLGRDPRALAQLERRLVRGGEISSGSGDQEPLLFAYERKVGGERLRDRPRQPSDILATQRRDRRDRAGVARGVAPALLDLGGADDDLVAELGNRPVRPSRHEPARPTPGARGFEGERGFALVRDEDEEIGVTDRLQGELERLNRFASGHRRVKRRPAAGEEQPRAGGKTPVSRHLRQPLGLRPDGTPGLFAVHER